MATSTFKWYPGHYYVERMLFERNTQTKQITSSRHVLKQDLPTNQNRPYIKLSRADFNKLLSDTLPDDSFQIIHLFGSRREVPGTGEDDASSRDRLEDCHFLDHVSQAHGFSTESIRSVFGNITVSFMQHLVGDEDEAQGRNVAFQFRARHAYCYWRHDREKRTTRVVNMRFLPPTGDGVEQFSSSLEKRMHELRQCFGHSMLPLLLLLELARQHLMLQFLIYSRILHDVEYQIDIGLANHVGTMHELRNLGRSSIRQKVKLTGFKRTVERSKEINVTHYLHQTKSAHDDYSIGEHASLHLNNLTSLIELDLDFLEYISQSVEHQLTAISIIVNMTDNTSMKTIAILTLFFLPSTYVASMFAMPMFPLSTSDHFWSYWAVSIPLTLVIVVLWLSWWYLRAAQQSYPVSFKTVKRFNARSESTSSLRSKLGYGIGDTQIEDRDWRTKHQIV